MIVEMMSSLLVNSLCYYLGSLLCVYNINLKQNDLCSSNRV